MNEPGRRRTRPGRNVAAIALLAAMCSLAVALFLGSVSAHVPRAARDVMEDPRVSWAAAFGIALVATGLVVGTLLWAERLLQRRRSACTSASASAPTEPAPFESAAASASAPTATAPFESASASARVGVTSDAGNGRPTQPVDAGGAPSHGGPPATPASASAVADRLVGRAMLAWPDDAVTGPVRVPVMLGHCLGRAEGEPSSFDALLSGEESDVRQHRPVVADAGAGIAVVGTHAAARAVFRALVEDLSERGDVTRLELRSVGDERFVELPMAVPMPVPVPLPSIAAAMFWDRAVPGDRTVPGGGGVPGDRTVPGEGRGRDVPVAGVVLLPAGVDLPAGLGTRIWFEGGACRAAGNGLRHEAATMDAAGTTRRFMPILPTLGPDRTVVADQTPGPDHTLGLDRARGTDRTLGPDQTFVLHQGLADDRTSAEDRTEQPAELSARRSRYRPGPVRPGARRRARART